MTPYVCYPPSIHPNLPHKGSHVPNILPKLTCRKARGFGFPFLTIGVRTSALYVLKTSEGVEEEELEGLSRSNGRERKGESGDIEKAKAEERPRKRGRGRERRGEMRRDAIAEGTAGGGQGRGFSVESAVSSKLYCYGRFTNSQ